MAENLDKTNPEATTGLAKAKIRLADVATALLKARLESAAAAAGGDQKRARLR